MPQCFAVGVGQRLARRRRRARRRPRCVIAMGAKAFRHRLRLRRGGPHRAAVARPDRCGRGVDAADAAHRGGPAGPASPSIARGAAGARGRARAAGGHAVPARRRDRRARRSSSSRPRSERGRSGARVRRTTTTTTTDDESTTTTPSRSRCRGRCTRCRRRRSPSTSTSATPSTHCARRCARPPTRSARCGPGMTVADVADPRGLVEQVLEVGAAAPSCPTTRRRGRCGCWRTPPTSTRSSPSAPG